MHFPDFDASFYMARRKRVQDTMREAGGGIALLMAAPEVNRNGDIGHPYRQDSNFLYLTGFPEPQACLVLIAGSHERAILFCRDQDEALEQWHGRRWGPTHAATHFGFNEAYSIERLDELLPEMLLDQPILFTPSQQPSLGQERLQRALETARAQSRSGRRVPPRHDDLLPMLAEMRLIKDAHEIAIMRQAAQISARAHARAMRVACPGKHEYEVEAELLHEFRRQGAQAVAYPSIVASGPNACILHYPAGNAVLANDQLILIDAGCEVNGYAADITRTFPVNGRYQGPQRLLYELVVAAQKAAKCETRAGRLCHEGHDAAVRVLAQGMIDARLLSGTLDRVLESQAYKRFYMHRTSHWLGLDVHDVGDYYDPRTPPGAKRPWRTLEKGMTLTLEPGIYVRPDDTDAPPEFRGIGIRIEDDALVTDDGCDLISRDVPVDAHEIETWIRDSR